jgi:hypothetical protein
MLVTAGGKELAISSSENKAHLHINSIHHHQKFQQGHILLQA